MVYEKYIKKGGKIFGPYLYETRRVNGKVVNTYLGPKNNAINTLVNKGKEINHDKKIFFINIFIVIFIAIFLGIFFGIVFNFVGEDFDLSEFFIGDLKVFLAPGIGDRVVAQGNFNATIVERPVIGKPVKWRKKIELKKGENVILIPKEANDIIVKKVKDSKSVKKEIIEKEDEKKKEVINKTINETESKLIDNESKIVVQNDSIINETIITNRSIIENNSIIEEVINESIDEKVAELNQTDEIDILTSPEITSEIIEKSDSKEVIIRDEPAEYEIEYVTEAPVAVENEINKYKKRVVVSGPELGYENILTFTNIPEVLEVGKDGSLRVYWVEKDSYEPFVAFDKNNNGLIDYIEWNTPYLSEQTFEISIIILNVQSYPTVGGNWTVLFNTTGIADLKIRASNGTTWTDSAESGYDLKFLELKCGENVVNTEFVKESANCETDTCYVLVRDYSCDGTGSEISKVLTPGKHTIKFEFGNETAYAHNLACGSISICENLDVTNCVYTLTADVSSSGTCFSVLAENVTLDCRGHNVNYSKSAIVGTYGVSSNADWTRVKNCFITDGASGTTDQQSHAIFFNGVDNGTISNNSIFTFHGGDDGIRLENIVDSNITNNKITTNSLGSDANGIRLKNSIRNVINNNNITTFGTYSAGIYLETSSDNNSIYNNVINVSGSGGYGGINIFSSNNNSINRNKIFTLSTQGGIYFSSSSDNIINNTYIDTKGDIPNGGIYVLGTSNQNNFYDSNISAVGNDIRFSAGGSGVFNLTNVSNARKISFDVASASRLNVHWYLDAYANYSNGASADEVNISMWNASFSHLFSELTNVNGRITRKIILEYSRNATDFAWQGNHTVNATKIGYVPHSRSINLTSSRFEVFTMNVAENVSECRSLTMPNTYYRLIQNIIWSGGDCIVIDKAGDNNITLDGQGFLIDVSAGTGAAVSIKSYTDNVTIKNLNISGSGNPAINVQDAEGILIINNSIKGSGTSIFLSGVTDLTVANITYNKILSNGNFEGIHINGLTRSSIINNNITSLKHGIFLKKDLLSGNSPHGNVISRNNIKTYGADAYGINVNSGDRQNISDNIIFTDGTTSHAISFNSISYSNIIGNIIATNGTRGYGINLSLSSNNNVLNNTIYTNGTFGRGVNLASSLNISIIQNTINTTGASADGIFITFSSNFTTIMNNVILTNGTDSEGIDMELNSHFTRIINNTLHISGSDTKAIDIETNSNLLVNNTIITLADNTVGVRLLSSFNNILLNNNINTSGAVGYGILLRGSSRNNTFVGIKINAVANALRLNDGAHNFSVQDSFLNSSSNDDFSIASVVTDGEFNFTNVTGRTERINVGWASGAKGALNVHWYLDAYANYTNSTNAANANISAFDNNSILQFSKLTEADGRIPRQILLEYKQTNNSIGGSVSTYYSNYTFIARSVYNENLQQSWNMSTNRFLVFTFDDLGFPLINFTNPTPPNATSVSEGFINVNVSIIGKNLKEVIFNWNKTNYSIYDDSLVLIMNFDNRSILGEDDTFVRDLSKYGNNGTVYRANWTNDGRYGGAFKFYNNSIINISNTSSLRPQEISVGVWFKADDVTGVTRGIFDKRYIGAYDSYVLRISSLASLAFCVAEDPSNPFDTNFCASEPGIQANRWYFVVGTFNRTTATLYLDGVLVSQKIGSRNILYSDDSLVIGYEQQGPNRNYFNGTIDELRIWNRSLSADEIEEQYYSNLFKYDVDKWSLYVNQNFIVNGTYTYQAFASNILNNWAATEERVLNVNVSYLIIDISDLGFQNIQPGKAEYVNFSVLVSNYIGQNLIRLNASFSRGNIARTNVSCARVADVSSTIANYSCSVDIWYFDPSGEWNVSADVRDSVGRVAYRNEIFNLMSEAFISHQGILSYGSLLPGDTNIIRDFLLNNIGNDAFSQIKIKGRNLLQQPFGPNIIPSVNFAVSDISASSCSGIILDHGVEKTVTGLTLQVGNNSINTRDSSSGQEELFICLKQVPIGIPSAEYKAGQANTWEITTIPPHTFA